MPYSNSFSSFRRFRINYDFGIPVLALGPSVIRIVFEFVMIKGLVLLVGNGARTCQQANFYTELQKITSFLFNGVILL